MKSAHREVETNKDDDAQW